MTRVIVAGLGNMGVSHALAHHHHPGAELVGLVNRSDVDLPDALQGYPRYRKFEDALADTKPDLACIATYSESHADYAVAAMEAGEKLDATVVNMRFIKPLDEDCIARMAADHRVLVTIEDNAVAGGAGSAVAETLAHMGSVLPLVMIGIPDRFIEHASRDQQLQECGLDADGIYRRVQRELAGRIATLRAVD